MDLLDSTLTAKPPRWDYETVSDSSVCSSAEDDHDVVHVPTDLLPDDVFGMMICSLCRDVFIILQREGSLLPRISRIVASMMLLAFTIYMQAFLLTQIKRYVTPPEVVEVREAYSMYEKHMYTESVLNVHNHSRGVSGFNASRFYDLTSAEQESVCRIPLSRPHFFGSVLFLWTVCNVADLKITWRLVLSLLLKTKTCNYMSDALVLIGEKGSHEYLIACLPIWMKVAIMVVVVIPRAVITLQVLNLGSQWLLATINLGELVLNAVALEFVLLIRTMFLRVFVSDRSQIDLQRTKIQHEDRTHSASLMSFVGHAFIGLGCVAWVALYVGIPRVHQGWQMTLPDYRWDAEDVCREWFETRFCIHPPCHGIASNLLTQLLELLNPI